MNVWDIVGSRSLGHLLEERVERYPDRTYLVSEDREGNVSELTYAQFDEQVNRVANGLRGMGIGKDDKVTIHLLNCPEFIVTWFALAKLGAVMVPANVMNTPPEMRHVLQRSESVAVVTEPAFLKIYETILPEIPAVRHLVLARTAESHPDAVLYSELLDSPSESPGLAATSDDIAELLFTSGTTADPKAVMLTHANLIRMGERISRGYAIAHDERCLTALPVFHVNGQGTFLYSMAVGAAAIMLPMFSATAYWDQLRRHRATLTSIVAMQARTLLAQPPADNDGEHDLRRVLYAINIPTEEKEAFEQRFGVHFLNVYGLTEACTAITMTPVYGPQKWPSVGRPAFDRQVRIVDDEGNDVPLGTPGEIIVHGIPGRTIMLGYYQQPEETAKAIQDGWLRTGDNGFADEDGYIYFFDRKKDVIKRAGENISATEVELVLNEHPGVAESAVIAVPDDIRDEAVKAFVVPVSADAVTEEDLLEHCRERLAKFKVPSFIEFREALPKTSVGKIEKKLLRAEEAERGA